MRKNLFSWIIEISMDQNVVNETLYLCFNYIDRFLSLRNVPKHRLLVLICFNV